MPATFGVSVAAILSGSGALGLDLDFAAGRYALNSGYSNALPAGWAFSRTGAGTALDSAGSIIQFDTGVPRIIADMGMLYEEARTNLLLNSATLSTQDVTTAAVAHTLSFYGTGTVTLTGTSTAGPLVGTGANNRVTLTFTPTAGTLTLTVTGSVTSANLEAGSFATSHIPTTGATATRGNDTANITGLGLPAPYTIVVEMIPLQVAGMDVVNTQTSLASGAGIYTGAPGVCIAFVREASVTTSAATTGNNTTVNVANKIAARYAVNDTNIALNGQVTTADGSNTPPTITRFNLSRPAYGFNGTYLSALVKRVRILPYAASDAELQALTA